MKEKHSIYFVYTVAIFLVSLLTSNIIAVKLFMVYGLVLTCGVIIFPVSYIVGDVLTEVYGFKLARKVIILGFLCNLLMVVFISIARVLPAPPFWTGQAAFDFILGFTPRLLLASFAAYLVGEIVNSFIMDKMKQITGTRHLWARTIGSTIVGQGLDSVIFISLAFFGHLPGAVLFHMILLQWAVKTGYEILITPFTYKAVHWLEQKESEKDIITEE